MSTSSSSDPSPLDGPLVGVVAHLVRRVHHEHARRWAQHVGAWPTPPQYAVLVVVADAPGCDLTTLARRAALDRTTVGRVVERLERDGWLARRNDAADGRRVAVHLTADGARRLAEVAPRAAAAGAGLTASLTATEVDTLRSLLTSVLRPAA